MVIVWDYIETARLGKMRRVYCFRVGFVLELNLGEKCPECGHINHKIYVHNNCGNYVDVETVSMCVDNSKISYQKHGAHCALPISHSGKCSHSRELVVEQIHES